MSIDFYHLSSMYNHFQHKFFNIVYFVEKLVLLLPTNLNNKIYSVLI